MTETDQIDTKCITEINVSTYNPNREGALSHQAQNQSQYSHQQIFDISNPV